MAEATLLVSAGPPGRGAPIRTVSASGLQQHRAEPPTAPEDAQRVVGCGRALVGERIAIVDPETAPRSIRCGSARSG